MDLDWTGVSEQVIGSLKSCLVEGDPEQRQRERRIRRRALLLSIVLQTIVVAALVLFPLLGKSERITYEQRILPPYAPHGPLRHNTPKGKPQIGTKQVCIVCFDPQNPPRPLKPGDRIDTTLNEREGDYVPGAPSEPGISGGLDLNPPRRLPEPPRERSMEPVKRLRLTTVEAAMLTHRVEPLYPPLARQLHREGRVELRALSTRTARFSRSKSLPGIRSFIHRHSRRYASGAIVQPIWMASPSRSIPTFLSSIR